MRTTYGPVFFFTLIRIQKKKRPPTVDEIKSFSLSNTTPIHTFRSRLSWRVWPSSIRSRSTLSYRIKILTSAMQRSVKIIKKSTRFDWCVVRRGTHFENGRMGWIYSAGSEKTDQQQQQRVWSVFLGSFYNRLALFWSIRREKIKIPSIGLLFPWKLVIILISKF